MKTDIFDNTDWAKLHVQKHTLLSIIREIEDEKIEDDERADDLNGILHLIDAFQDHAVDELGLPEELVFGKKEYQVER